MYYTEDKKVCNEFLTYSFDSSFKEKRCQLIFWDQSKSITFNEFFSTLADKN